MKSQRKQPQMERSMFQAYVRRSDVAAELYKEAFGLDEVADYGRHDDGTYMHAELDVFGQVLALSELPKDATPSAGNTMQLCLHLGGGKEDVVRKAYDVLQDGATIHYPLAPCDWSSLMFGLVDKHGVNWCVFC